MPAGSTEPVAAGARPPGWVAPWRRRRVVVADASMAPALRPGDRLVLDRGAYRTRRPAVGEVVVLVDPDDPGRWLVKRVAGVDPAAGTVDVRGDAGDVSRDSRRFGPVPVERIVGRAVRIYFPPDRRRAL
ncbi:MAG TPA: S26 family signal peptidase [Thermoplasmata archaeon]|jgi:nickel-type superoxide dismutase maturation protease|nr:S26 family signal peptidase [Thermoplasmata archaeon]